MASANLVSRIAHDACLEAPTLLDGDERWWESLDPSFASQPEVFRLARRERLQVSAAATYDVAVRTAAACIVGGLAGPFAYRPQRIREAIEDRTIYGPLADSGDPTRFFRAPREPAAVRARRAFRPTFRPKDGLCQDLRYESAYVPFNPRERPRFLKHRANRYAHVRTWRHRDGPRPTIVAIHGFSADLYQLNEFVFALPWLYKLGLDVCLFTLPFHGRRRAATEPFSGYGLFAGGINRQIEAFGQAVHDFRALLDYLEQRLGVTDVGVMGISLGGYTTGLLATVEPRLRFAIANVPVASTVDLAMEWEPLGTAMRVVFRAAGLSLQDARQITAVASPLTYPPLLPRERLFVIGGVGDRLAPPKHSRLLWDHWGRCRLHWFPGSHVLHLDRGQYLRETARFLRDIGFLDGLAPPARPD